ncbi:MAG: hypothetical protein J6B87_01630 [Clostridia bacterium]|nr:hypothetical protein [Clostridia bacterium]
MNVLSGIGNLLSDIVANPMPYLLLALWIVIAWILSRDEGKSFVGMLFKSFLFFLGLLLFHAVMPVIFWIVIGLTVAISVFLALKGG